MNINRIAVIGGGAMGNGIAQVAATAGANARNPVSPAPGSRFAAWNDSGPDLAAVRGLQAIP